MANQRTPRLSAKATETPHRLPAVQYFAGIMVLGVDSMYKTAGPSLDISLPCEVPMRLDVPQEFISLPT